MLRVRSIDALRGLAMIIMALDHTREFFHNGAMVFQPEDLTRTTAALFFTRWITHVCAPIFVFTAGLSAYLWFTHNHTKPQLSQFLATRGVWLIVLELTAMRFALNFSLTNNIVLLSILWVLGLCMIVLSVLIYLPVRFLAPLSIAVIALHNLLDPIQANRFGSAAGLWNVLHQPGVFMIQGIPVLAAYPLIPWFAVMAAGYCFAQIQHRRKWLIPTGLALTAAFVIIRAINIYGNPTRWSTQIPGMTVLSFLRTTKYPPSLDFLLMTLGPAILIWAWLDHLNVKPANPLIVFGRVPLFYFLAHLFLIHVFTVPLALIRYGAAAFLLNPLPSMGGQAKLYPPDFGYDLWAVYAIWLTVVVLLYPVCRWFGRLKQQKSRWWLSYL